MTDHWKRHTNLTGLGASSSPSHPFEALFIDWESPLGRVRQSVPPAAGAARNVNQLAEENERLRRQLADREQENADLRARLRQALGAATRERADLTPIEATRHSDIARDFQTLVEQDIQHLARALPASLVDRRHNHWVAKATAKICNALFAGDLVSLDGLHRQLRLDASVDGQLVADVHTQSTIIRRNASAHASVHRWDFFSPQGELLDIARQVPWGQCDVRQPIRFVVAPAYVADGEVHCKQQVYTASLSSTKPSRRYRSSRRTR